MTRNGKAFELPMLAPHTDESESGLLPTPRAIYGEHPGMLNRSHLTGAVHFWPTPNVPNGGRQPKGGMSRTGMTPDGKNRQVGLHNAVKWATPKSSPSGPDYARKDRDGSGADDLATQVGGQLNPTWVEWLMGYPAEWTALKDSETP
jgi:hypothetical protein